MGSGLFLLYQELGAKSPSWNLDFAILHISVHIGHYSIRKIDISIFHMKHWFFSYRKIYVPFLLMFSYALNICVSNHMSLLHTFVCISVWMYVQPQPAEMNVTDY